MDPIIGGALIGGAINLGGGILNSIGVGNQNQANRQNASDDRAWQQWMSNSAHQREAADYELAGLNPILTAKGGASTPSGAQAVAQNTMEGASAAAAQTAQIAMSVKKMQSEVDLMDAQKKKTNTEERITSKGEPAAAFTSGIWKKLTDFTESAKGVKAKDFTPSGRDDGSPKSLDEWKNERWQKIKKGQILNPLPKHPSIKMKGPK